MADQVNPVVVDPAPPLPPPSRHHRPRVREVSSRFMSSIASPSPSDVHHHQNHHHVPKSPVSKHTPMPTPDTHSRPLHRSKSAQRQRGGGVETEAAEPLTSRSVDDNNVQLDTTRSLESPLKGVLHGVRGSVVQRNNKRSGASVKLVFKENNGGNNKSEHQQPSEVLRRRGGNGNFTATPSRPDTPMVTPNTSTDHRVVSSRFRLSGTVQKGGIGPATTTAAAKLLQSSGMMSSSFNAAQLPPNPHGSNSNGNGGALGRENDTCPAPSNPSSDCSLGSDSEEDLVQKDCRLRSSLSEVEVSSTLLGDRSCSVGNNGVGCNSSKLSASPCSRSLNLPLSSYDHSSSLLHTVGRPGEKPAKPLGNSGKTGSLCLPPLPCPKQGGDSKKVRKDSSNAEQVHTLKLLHNHHLQWRFANAKAEATVHAQRREAERDLYSLQVKISSLRDAVERKQIELGLWKRTLTLSTILEAHMPYLDEWSALEGEYLSSLSGVIDALVNASLQLPVGGNVQVDIKEVREALNAALKMTESICLQIQNFMPKAEEMDTSISELARVSGGERALVEECGHLLFKTHTSQVEECSLRGHLIQLHSSNHHQAKEEQAFLSEKF